ncbi:MAG: response regulator [Alphaproteobacteria bacterium]|nr:response regulator [Alphaproteobacteria bacterium]
MTRESENIAPSMRRILVVEDSLTVSDLIVGILNSLGFEQVFCASDGMEAWSLFEDGLLFDLVICDWMMPKMNGLDVLKQLRSSHSNVPFIMISGKAAESEIAEARVQGVTAFVPKPFEAAQLIQAVTVSLEEYDARTARPDKTDVWEI